MKTFRHFLALGLFLGISCAALPARAQSPTLITTAPYVITKAGKYQLDADLYYAGNGSANDAIITIAASNVTLDFAGHYISGPSNSTATELYGIYSYQRGNLTIKNGTIVFCYTGINLDGMPNMVDLVPVNINQRVENMLISYCYYTGVRLYASRNSEVRNCRISFIGGSSIIGSSNGIYADGIGHKLTNNTITNVTRNNNQAWGIQCAAYYSFSIGNTISNCYYGIAGSKRQRNLSSGCTVPFATGTDGGLNN